eukprot:3586614-Prymnesium_polylepis.1
MPRADPRRVSCHCAPLPSVAVARAAVRAAARRVARATRRPAGPDHPSHGTLTGGGWGKSTRCRE